MGPSGVKVIDEKTKAAHRVIAGLLQENFSDITGSNGTSEKFPPLIIFMATNLSDSSLAKEGYEYSSNLWEGMTTFGN